jgi:glycosyltransferase involved in cell wall biosynthesis
LRTIVNLIERFSDRYQFFIVTRNHDNRNDLAPFAEVRTGEWNGVDGAHVMYLGSSEITSTKVASIVNEIDPAGVYLNSLFSKPVISFLFARRRQRFPRLAVVLAPCGEVAPSALASKSWKKRIFLTYARLVGLYSNVIWKASSETEKGQIRKEFGQRLGPSVAPDLPPRAILPSFSPDQKPEKHSGEAKFVFLSRIDRIKNLDFVIDRLSTVEQSVIQLTIAGPIENEQYWKEIEGKLDRLPKNIQVRVVGGMSYNDGLQLLVESHFLVLPTKGENFGYVLLEALAAGCPIVVSDQTIWNQAEAKDAGWAMSLDDPARWESILDECVSMDQVRFSEMSSHARSLAVNWLGDPENESATGDVLRSAFGE